jgi:hypothetical protein
MNREKRVATRPCIRPLRGPGGDLVSFNDGSLALPREARRLDHGRATGFRSMPGRRFQWGNSHFRQTPGEMIL